MHSHSISLPAFAQTNLIDEREAKCDGRISAKTYQKQAQTDHIHRISDASHQHSHAANCPSNAHGQPAAEIVSNERDDEEAENGSHEHHILKQRDFVLLVVAYEVGVELKDNRRRVPVDVVRPLVRGQLAYELLALDLVSQIGILAGVGVIEEEGHA